MSDLSQSIGRTRTKMHGASCVTPRMRPLLLHRGRMATGLETMALQGLHFGQRHLKLREVSRAAAQNLAGNAFNGHCCAAAFVVGLAVVSQCWSARRDVANKLPARVLEGSEDLDAQEDDLWP